MRPIVKMSICSCIIKKIQKTFLICLEFGLTQYFKFFDRKKRTNLYNANRNTHGCTNRNCNKNKYWENDNHKKTFDQADRFYLPILL